MSHGTTSKLTPALLKRVIELRSEDYSYDEIVFQCRSEDFRISKPDITHWRKRDDLLELDGETATFREHWEAAEECREDECRAKVKRMAKEIVEISDAKIRQRKPDRRQQEVKERYMKMRARVWALNSYINREARMSGLQKLQHSGEVAGSHTLIVPRSKLFGEIDEDEQGDA